MWQLASLFDVRTEQTCENPAANISTLAVVNVKQRHEFRLRFFPYTLPRVELPVAMLT